MEENKNTTTTTDQPNTAPETKTYSQDEVEKLIQSEADRRVNQARSRWEKETSKKLSEAEKLAKMSQEDQFKYALEQKEAELAQKEREFNLRDMKIAGMKTLADKGISPELIDFVVAEDAEVMNENIKKLDKFIKASVASEVKAKLGGTAPKAGTVAPEAITKESFAKMSYSQKMEIYQTNRELYNKLAGK